MTIKIKSVGRVTLSASVRVARLMVFEISQRISSTRTADSAMFVENVALAMVRAFIRSFSSIDVLPRHAKPGSWASCWLFRGVWPDSSGKSLCDTATATMKKVATKGSAETVSYTHLTLPTKRIV